MLLTLVLLYVPGVPIPVSEPLITSFLIAICLYQYRFRKNQ